MANSTASASLDATPDFGFLVQLLGPQLLEVCQAVQAFREQPPTPERTWKFETDLDQGLREAGRVLLGHEVNRVEPEVLEACPLRMRLAGEEYKRRPKSPNTIGTLFGPIQLQRYLYEPLERGEKSIFPLELQLGIEAGLATPALAERVGLLAVDRTQQQVRDELARAHGVSWSAQSLRKLLASLRSGLSSFRESTQVEKLLELLKQAARSKGPHRPVLAAGRDGIMVPMRHGGNQEAATGTVSVLDRRGKRLGTVYLGRMPESGQGSLTDQLTALLTQTLTQWQGCPLRYVYVTDGGYHPQEYYDKVLRKMADPQRPGQRLDWQWVIDFWHACTYLAKLKESLFGDAPAGWAWFKKMRHWLRHRLQGVADVMRSATQLRNRRKRLDPERAKLFADSYGYLCRHAQWMAYARYRRQGYPIGSGVTEAACKTVFTQRLKQSGMTWTVAGGQVIIDLRVLVLSGIWPKVFRAYQQSRSVPQPVLKGRPKLRRVESLKKAA